MKKREPQLLSIQQAAAFLGVHPDTIRRWANSKKLKGVKIGSRGDWRFTKAELEKMMTSDIPSNHSVHACDDAVRAERERIYHLFMQAPIPIGILKGPDHVYELSNDLTNKVLQVENPVGKSIKELFPDNKEILGLLDTLYKTGQSFTASEYPINLEVPGKGKQTIYVNATYQPLRDQNNTIIGIMTTGVDVTEHVLFRQKLQESEEYFRTLVEAIPQLVFIADKQGNPIFYNKRWFEYTGLHNEFDVNDWVEAIHPDDLVKVTMNFEKAKKKKNEFSAEYRLRDKHGKYHWFLGRSVPVLDKKGNIYRWFGTATFIQQQRETEEALRESEKKFRELTNHVPVGIFLTDVNGDCQFVNESWCDITGLTAEQAQGPGWASTLHPDDKERVFNEWYQVAQNKQEFNSTYRFKTPEGKIRWVSCKATALYDHEGTTRGYLGSVTDITERKLSEEKQRKLERQKDEFLGVASHELKTPVTSIKAYTQVLQHMFKSKGDAKSVDLLGKMDGQINKLNMLIADLLDVTKIEAGKLYFRSDYFDFNELVTEVVEEIQRTTNRHTITVKLNKSRTVFGDRDRTGQVITNFLTNAIKYSPHTKAIIVSTTIDKKHVSLCVQDFGVGIPQEKQEHIFERFYRIEGKKEDTYPGLGLGLYIASEFIKRQGGKIWVESEMGQGSTFCFSLPIQRRKIRQQRDTITEEAVKHE